MQVHLQYSLNVYIENNFALEKFKHYQVINCYRDVLYSRLCMTRGIVVEIIPVTEERQLNLLEDMVSFGLEV